MFIALIASCVLVLAAGSPSFAQDCEQIDKKRYNERINCKTEKLTNKVDEVVTLVTEEGGDLLSEKTKKHLKEASERAKRAKDRAHGAKGFSNLARRQKVGQGCHIVENDTDGKGNDDGICGNVKVEWKDGCVELGGDGVGDDDLICEKKEVCLEVCDEVNIHDEEDDDIFDEDLAADVEQSFDESAELMGELEVGIKERIAVLNALRSRYQGLITSAEAVDYCDSLQQSRPITITYQIIAMAAARSTETLHNLCDSLMNQDTAGWNASAACAVTAGIAGVVVIAADLLDMLDNDISSMELDAAVKCLEQTDDKMTSLSKKVGDTGAQVTEIFKMVETLQKTVDEKLLLLQTKLEQVDTTLNTPPGRRPEFPVKD
jgi:hypothetical protein